ncbi:MAG: SDR family NAD(P)-dependent oxidoreductase [Candidatus Eremiobacteraeota bacterium]|nr:SDR family NAD(P)-dependent oxidoreductase [Candidatus Eremiobacteraeota bacterium]MCW5868459.1 SDR family NAD(P)-dependent oxidoreductase [Candidatus Eremiobacteraeota bacterium]
MDDLRGAVAVVLGAENGVGASLAKACLQRGMRVVADPERVEGPLRLVVNATRWCRGGNPWETSWPDWRGTMDLHLGGCLQLYRLIARHSPPVPMVTVCWTDPANTPFFVSQRAVLALHQNLYVSTSPGKTHVLFADGRESVAGADELFAGLARGQFYLRMDPEVERQARERLAAIRESGPAGELPFLEKGRVAVITGAAGGIGLALARRCLNQGMKVVLSDVHRGDLEQAARELPSSEFLCVATDVSRVEQVEELARAALERFGGVHLLVNNAGVGAGGSPLESTPNDWEWVMGVNFWGVVAALKVFVPLLLSQGQPAHILNTASLAGLLAYHPSSCYHVSKQAVVALSESLRDALQGSGIGVSVLCPGYVNTHILHSSRNRPVHLLDEDRPPPRHLRLLQAALRHGMAPEEVAERALEELRRGRFYLFTHPEMLGGVEENLRDLLALHHPRNPNRLGAS